MTTRKQPGAEAEAYLTFLRERPGASLDPTAETKALNQFKDYLSNLRDPATRGRTAEVYAPDAFFNDTLKTVIGADAIRGYFDHTAANTDDIRVEFADVARSGDDYYLRWVMDVKFRKFHRGKTFRSIGITHVRFDNSGRVILHQDYWDSSAGFFEQVPVLGSGIRYIKSLL